MQAIRFAPELSRDGLSSLLTRSIALVGWSALRKRAEELRGRIVRAAVWEPLIQDRHSFELALYDVRSYQRKTGRVPWPPKSESEYRLFATLAMIDRVLGLVNKRGKRTLVGQVRASLGAELGLCPLAYEFEVAAHLLRRGFVVYAHDMEEGGGYDFLAQKGEIEAEIECKYISADIGRQIHRNRFCQLAERLQPIIKPQSTEECRLIKIDIPSRLNGAQSQHIAISDAVNQALLNGIATKNNDCNVSLDTFQFEHSPFSEGRPALGDIEIFLEQRCKLIGGHAIVSGSDKGVCIAYLRSLRSDNVLDRILHRLKADAKAQFTGKRPAILCIFLADLSQEQLVDLAQDEQRDVVTGIRQAVSTLIHRRPHIHTVALMARGTVSMTRRRSEYKRTTEIAGSGPTYYFQNTGHPDAGNKILKRLFGN